MHRTLAFGHPQALPGVRRFLLVAGGITLLAGCDAHKVTEPAAVPTPAGRQNLLPEPIGYTFLAPPANSSLAAVGSITWQAVGTIPDSTWVVITANGGITQSWNPGCASAPPYFPCQTGPVTYPFGSGPSNSGPVSISVQGSNGWSPARMRGVGGVNSNTAIGLHFQRVTGGMSAKIDMMAKWAWHPDAGPRPYSYDLSGGYDVEALPIASPMVVVDNGPVDPSGTRNYALQTFPGLQFMNPSEWSWNWPAGATNWYFFPGSGVGEKPNFLGRHYELVHCRFQLSCNYAPPGPGRVQAAAYVEMQYVMARTSDLGPCNGLGGSGGEPNPLGSPSQDIISCLPIVETPTLQVACTPSVVTRGQPVSCTAASVPDGTLANIRWHFAPDPVTIHPKAGPVGMADSVSEYTTLPKWEGDLVLSGKVTVHASLNGVAHTAFTYVRASERSWNTGPGPAAPLIDPGWGIRPETGVSYLFAENVHIEPGGARKGGVALLGAALGASAPVDASHIRTVPAGPNQGYIYIGQHEIRLNRAHRVNVYITPGNTDLDVLAGGAMENRWNALNVLGWGNPADFLTRATEHETYGTGGRVGHQDGFVDAVTGEVCGNLARRIERIAGSAARVGPELELASAAAFEFHSVGTDHHRVHGHMQNARVVMKAPGSTTPLQYTSNDAQTPLGGAIMYRHVCEYEKWGL
jgi:hypothetical protein